MLFFWLFFILESFVLMLMRGHDQLALDDSIYWFCIVLNSVVLIACVAACNTDNPFLVKCLVLGYILRILFLIWVQYFSEVLLLPNAGFDEFRYYYQAMHNIIYNKYGWSFYHFLTVQARVYGLSLLYCRYVNIPYSIMAILYFNKTLQLLNVSTKTYRTVIALACLLPNYALLSGLLLRESLIIMLLSISCYYLVNWWKEDQIVYFGISMVCSFTAALLHTGAIAFPVCLVIVYFCSHREGEIRVLKLFDVKNIALSFVMLFMALLFMRSHESSALSYASNMNSFSDVVRASDVRATGGSGYSADIVANDSIGGFIINTPLHVLLFLFSPLPWQWRGLSDILAFFMSAVLYLFITILLLRNRDILKNNGLLTILILIALCAAFLFGWGVSNAGTALRHRDKFLFVYLSMLAIILEHRAMKQVPLVV